MIKSNIISKNQILPACCIFLLIMVFCLSCSKKTKKDATASIFTEAFQIVVDKNNSRTSKLAATELQQHLEKMTGRDIPVRVTPSTKYQKTIYVGESEFTRKLGIKHIDRLKYGAYKIYGEDDWIALIGNDTEFVPNGPFARYHSETPSVMNRWDQLTDAHWGNPLLGLYRHYSSKMDLWEYDQRGSLNAVYHFLRKLGVRWYLPGEFGTYIPQLDSIPFPQKEELITPDFAIRNMYQYGKNFFNASESEILWQLRLGLYNGQEFLGHGDFTHGINMVIARDEIRKRHPEYYAVINGVRKNMDKNNKKACLSQRGLIEANARYVQSVFDVYDEPVVSVMPSDGLGTICECDQCQKAIDAKRGEKGKFSDYVWNYVNEVGKIVYRTHPDKKILCFAYTTYLLPPTDIKKLSPNLVVGVCRTRSTFHDSKQKDRYRDIEQAWQRISQNNLIIWDYYLHARENSPQEGVPIIYPATIESDLRYLKDKSDGEFIEVFRHYPARENDWNDLAVNHINMYLTARMYWDTGLDKEYLLEEYYAKFYGPAASKMKTFFEYSEQNWPDMLSKDDQRQQAFNLIKAAQDVKAAKIYRDRINMVANYIRPMQAMKDIKMVESAAKPVAYDIRAMHRKYQSFKSDGKLNDQYWDGLHAYPLRPLMNKKATTKAFAKFAWKSNSLNIGLLCDRHSGWNSKDANDVDRIEIVLKTLDQTVYTLYVHSDGELRGLKEQDGKKSNWNSGAKAVLHQAKDSWSAEIQIPIGKNKTLTRNQDFSISGRLPSPNYPWYLNVYRTIVVDGVKERYDIIASLENIRPEAFAELMFR